MRDAALAEFNLYCIGRLGLVQVCRSVEFADAASLA